MNESIFIKDFDTSVVNLETRLPCEFGVATMTELPHCLVRLRCAIEGSDVTGLAADHLPPRWFTKDESESVKQEIGKLFTAIEQACRYAEGKSGTDVFTCWRGVYEAQRNWGEQTSHPSLLWTFGVSFVERALIDAYCRGKGISFGEAIRTEKFGIRPGVVYPELRGLSPAHCLPDESATTLQIRHTVGYGDPLRDSKPSSLSDGLPVSLTENITTYGLERFKIKVKGDVDSDADRLEDVLSVIEDFCGSWKFTLDANEQYHSLEKLQALLGRLRKTPYQVDSRLRFIEQPFPRQDAFTEEVSSWEGPPLVIDESDDSLDSCGRALSVGYAGTSHKNCKGVFKSIINACLIQKRKKENPGGRYILSAEDLTTIGPVSLLQDLAVVASLGISEAERNGHHYFRGLARFDHEWV